MTDILVPLMKDGSKYDNLELRYCLRSIEKHLKNYRNIYIIGELPPWINPQTIIHIPFEDSTDNKQRAWNIYRKIITGCNYINDLTFEQSNEDFIKTDITVSAICLSDNFLFMNDDHFLLTNYVAGEFPYYNRGPIQTHRVGNEAQRIQMENTVKALAIFKARDYDLHCGIVYNKILFRKAFENFEWPEYGYGIKSIYGNTQVSGFLNECEDLKISTPMLKTNIYEALEKRQWFSIGDKTLHSGAMQEVLNELYSSPSKYEL